MQTQVREGGIETEIESGCKRMREGRRERGEEI